MLAFQQGCIHFYLDYALSGVQHFGPTGYVSGTEVVYMLELSPVLPCVFNPVCRACGTHYRTQGLPQERDNTMLGVRYDPYAGFEHQYPK